MKNYNTHLLAIAVAAGSLFFVSCGSDDDEVKPNESTQTQEEQKKDEDKKQDDQTQDEPTKPYDHQMPNAVDLGLSVKWATCNLDADAPEDFGGYYGFGCTDPYPNVEDVSYELYFQYIGGSGTSYTDCGTDKDPLKGIESISGTKWDAAHVKLGGKWRLPTKEEVSTLVYYCKWEWTKQNNVEGYRVTANNGNSIFLPATGDWYNTDGTKCLAGYYLTGTHFDYYHTSCIRFTPDKYERNASYVCNGYSIRPVCD